MFRAKRRSKTSLLGSKQGKNSILERVVGDNEDCGRPRA